MHIFTFQVLIQHILIETSNTLKSIVALYNFAVSLQTPSEFVPFQMEIVQNKICKTVNEIQRTALTKIACDAFSIAATA